LGSSQNTTSQQATPAKKAAQTVSAPPLDWTISLNAEAAPTHAGSSKIPTRHFNHFGTSYYWKFSTALQCFVGYVNFLRLRARCAHLPNFLEQHSRRFATSVHMVYYAHITDEM
jgi:hypothetical protein